MTDTPVRAAGARTDWVWCDSCKDLIYGKRLARNLWVCPVCGFHHRVTAHERIAQLFDPEPVEFIDVPAGDRDPLAFVDTRPYPDRLRAAREATGLDEAVVVARGRIQGSPVVAAVMDFRFLGGSLGGAVGELVTRAAGVAGRERIPLLIVSASGGARMQEGAIALMQMAKTSQALEELGRAGVLTLALITDPTFGGVAASFAALCDVIVAEPGARMGFAGPRVIEQTVRRKLPAGFQTAEFLLEHGMVDAIRRREELRTTLGRILSVGGGCRVSQPAEGTSPSARVVAGELSAAGEVDETDEADEVVRDPDRLPEKSRWQAVRQARDLMRPTALDYIHRLCDGFEELHGDRVGGDCHALVGGTAKLGGIPVMVIGHQKGHTVSELIARNFGMATPAGYRRAARLMRLAGKLSLPVVTFVDTPGAYPGVEAEENGQAGAIAESIRLMTSLPVPVVSVVTGEGGSGGALALAVADEVLVCSGAVYSVISPEGCAAILWNDPAMAPTAAEALRLDARELLRLGVVDAVVPEPPGGAHTDVDLTVRRVGAAVVSAVRRLSAIAPVDLLAARRARLRAHGGGLDSGGVVGGGLDSGGVVGGGQSS